MEGREIKEPEEAIVLGQAGKSYDGCEIFLPKVGRSYQPRSRLNVDNLYSQWTSPPTPLLFKVRGETRFGEVLWERPDRMIGAKTTGITESIMTFSEVVEVESVAIMSSGICLTYVKVGDHYDLHILALSVGPCPGCGENMSLKKETVVPGVCTLDYLRRQYGAYRLHDWDRQMKNFALVK
ncbi:MAG: hypothetical protein UY76_C0048G0005 [Candidatus Uhrbacteria bacterium GW2011_GWA2_52_8d]|uniref:Uncharacterized protein n=1 Tax=Candidatus Uhrbacteria bacterium GW2011_GWA2_52_8d TaxID=1618979 RepID=A0A0G1ZU64_9BACT|nr:MAG: hypothetical protein UY76_C0048G0005 [Candidatus Uhrbacteria bacterium GW2011_GWA2_52_8d]